jgi:hypothetical protein
MAARASFWIVSTVVRRLLAVASSVATTRSVLMRPGSRRRLTVTPSCATSAAKGLQAPGERGTAGVGESQVRQRRGDDSIRRRVVRLRLGLLTPPVRVVVVCCWLATAALSWALLHPAVREGYAAQAEGM